MRTVAEDLLEVDFWPAALRGNTSHVAQDHREEAQARTVSHLCARRRARENRNIGLRPGFAITKIIDVLWELGPQELFFNVGT
jgi:hypothetical protein